MNKLSATEIFSYRTPRGITPWAFGVLSLLVIIWYNWFIYPWMLDDAFITFRYADNFSSGHGLVYNPGERVEGYTAFLWVLVLGVGKTIGLNIIFMSKLLGGAFGLATIGVLLGSYRILSGVSSTATSIAVILLGTCGVFTPWILSGMEVVLYTFLTLVTLLVYLRTLSSGCSLRGLAVVGVLLALTAMTRPEGALLVLIIFADNAYRSLRGRTWSILYLALPAALIYVPYFSWRYAYYGYFLPNTYYAKVGSTSDQILRGFDYIEGSVLPVLLLLLPAIWALFKFRSFFITSGRYLLPLFVILHIGYVILVGGDCMPAFRFLAPVIPLLALLAGMGVSAIVGRSVLVIALTVLMGSYNVHQMVSHPRITPHIQIDRVAYNGREVGLWLKANFPPETLIATNAAGSLPYYSELPTIDMLGLNDVHIAHRKIPSMGLGTPGHEKGDGEYVLSRDPDLIQFFSSIGSSRPSFLSDRELWGIQHFHEKYRAEKFYIPSLNLDAVFFVKTPSASNSRHERTSD
ncbi:MAG: hypothetical protein KOO62_12715 [candidate division Zixibacteria bacterium]|nr:hypothetical protein [candidate division Zixibacteria bacterium]